MELALSPFPTMFSTLSTTSFNFLVTLVLLSANALNLSVYSFVIWEELDLYNVTSIDVESIFYTTNLIPLKWFGFFTTKLEEIVKLKNAGFHVFEPHLCSEFVKPLIVFCDCVIKGHVCTDEQIDSDIISPSDK